VAKIDSLSAKSKRARNNLDHVSRLVEKYKQAILAAAYSGELTREWSQSHSTKRLAFGRANIDQRIGNLRSLPETWCWAAIYNIATISGGLTKNAERKKLQLRAPYLRVANVYANELRLSDVSEIGITEVELKKTILRKGDLLIVEGNGSLEQIGRVAVWNDEINGCSHQNHIIRGRPGPDVLSAYVLYWLLSPDGRAAIETVASSSSGLYTLSISKVEQLPIPVCDKAEQQEIVRRLQAAFSWIGRLASDATSARKLIDHLDQAILAKAFRGELVPQGPNDKPASVLLERISAERQAADTPRVQGKQKARTRGSAVSLILQGNKIYW
jgi:type I restriction enzyme S subunit